MPEVDLPVEIYHEIFRNFLPIQDIFNCRSVCKRWMAIIDLIKLRSLVIAEDEYKFTLNRTWFGSDEGIDTLHTILCPNLSRSIQIESQLRRSLFSSVKQLYIHSNYLSFKSSDLGNCLNHFTRLERLEILNLEIQAESKLVLPNLRSLNIIVRGDLLILDTPCLEKLKIQFLNTIDNIKFLYPKRIKYAEFQENRKLLRQFTEIEQLYCKRFESIEDDFLLNHPQLKQVHFDGTDQVFAKLKAQKERLHRRDLKIYFLGIHFDHLPQYSSALNHSDLYEKNVKLLAENYPKQKVAGVLPFVEQVNYNIYEENFKQLPKDLVRRFVNLEQVRVTNKVNDPRKFANFLTACSNFSNLKLVNSALDSHFYSHLLPECCPSLTGLTIKDQHVDELDFDFCFRLDYLITLITNKQLSIEFVYDLFTRLKHFEQIWFNHLEDKVRIVTREDRSLRLFINEKESQFNDVEEMFEFMRNNLLQKMCVD